MIVWSNSQKVHKVCGSGHGGLQHHLYQGHWLQVRKKGTGPIYKFNDILCDKSSKSWYFSCQCSSTLTLGGMLLSWRDNGRVACCVVGTIGYPQSEYPHYLSRGCGLNTYPVSPCPLLQPRHVGDVWWCLVWRITIELCVIKCSETQSSCEITQPNLSLGTFYDTELNSESKRCLPKIRILVTKCVFLFIIVSY